MRQELIERRLDVESRVRRRLERAKAEGDLGPDADPAALAMYVMTICQGIALQAGMGAIRAALRHVVNTALQACPCVKAAAAA